MRDPRTCPASPRTSAIAPSAIAAIPVAMNAAATTLVRLPSSELIGGWRAISAPTPMVASTASRRVMALHSAAATLTLPALRRPIPETFPAFLATQRDDAVDRGPATLAAADLGEGEVTVRVDWSSINYKDALATIPKGQVARISPLVPGIDLAGEVVASDDAGRRRRRARCCVTGYDLGVAHHGGWAQLRARARRRGSSRCPTALSARQAMALGTAGLTAGLSIHALEAHGLRPDDGPVLVLGASGGVGSTAVGALAAAGYEVWAATGKPDQHDYLRGLGAHEIVTREETSADSERPLEKTRWAATVDPVGGSRHRLRPAHDALWRRRRPQRPHRRHEARHDGPPLHPARREPAGHRLGGGRRRAPPRGVVTPGLRSAPTRAR